MNDNPDQFPPDDRDPFEALSQQETEEYLEWLDKLEGDNDECDSKD